MELQKSDRIIIPWDFTEVAENALKYAFAMSLDETSIFELLHVLNKGGVFSGGKSDEKEISEMLEKEALRIEKQYSVRVKTKILEGSLFDVISDYATEKEASLVVMGTHGMVGMQKLVGSKALKVIDGSNVPFIVVQDAPKTEVLFKDIVFPVDYRKEVKEMLRWAKQLVPKYQSTIHLIKQHQTDPGMRRKVDNNFAFCKNYFELHNLPFESHVVPKSGNFYKEVLFQAKNLKSDLIFILTTKNIDFSDYLLGAREQHIIANEFKIPILCINPSII